jgi:hypothetical protein
MVVSPVKGEVGEEVNLVFYIFLSALSALPKLFPLPMLYKSHILLVLAVNGITGEDCSPPVPLTSG